ncbi:MAG: di-trans,poly-cis-decaprenylcistransferase [Spirochaetaceae bacterium]|nr:MAG: di-trans,poly-cis-decaprenylcistransferase [Spirochaetaceae bacterium]
MKNAALPQHIGIIMDGNGRWAKKRLLPRTRGHQEGLKTAKKIIGELRDLGVTCVTLYAFSTENWKRAQEEVSFLFSLIQKHIRKELDFYREKEIKIIHSGDMSGLPAEVKQDIESVIRDTAAYDGIIVNLALNYGGRNEIVRAVQKMITENPDRDFTAKPVCDDDIEMNLDTRDIPAPDLIIRTGNEMRLSNFLLWESAYSELYFTTKLWPDFSKKDLLHAIADYQKRSRRFGSVHD